jgi:biopolymer transport protein ExbD
VKFQRRRDEEVGVNLTPLIDVVFLLLIFFMVSTTFERHGEIQLQLPSADRDPSPAQQAWIDVLVDATGTYYVDGRELVNRRPETLQRMLETVLGERSGQPVLVRADANASHQSVVTALDVIGKLGVTSVSIATIGRTPDDP